MLDDRAADAGGELDDFGRGDDDDPPRPKDDVSR